MKNRLMRGVAIGALSAALSSAGAGLATAQEDAPSARDIAAAVIASDAERVGDAALALAARDDVSTERRAAGLDIFLAVHPDAAATLFAALAVGAAPETAPAAAETDACRIDALAAAMSGDETSDPCAPPALDLRTLPSPLLSVVLEVASPEGARRSADAAQIRAVAAAALARAVDPAADVDAALYGAFLARTGPTGADETLGGVAALLEAGVENEPALQRIVLALAAAGETQTAETLVGWYVAERDVAPSTAIETRRRLAAAGLAQLPPDAPFDGGARQAWLAALLDIPEPPTDKRDDALADPVTARILAPLIRPDLTEWTDLFVPALEDAAPTRRAAIFSAWRQAYAVENRPAPTSDLADAIVESALLDAAPLFSDAHQELDALAFFAPFVAEGVAAALGDRVVEGVATSDARNADERALWRATLARVLSSPDAALADSIGAQLFALSADPIALLNEGLDADADAGATGALRALNEHMTEAETAGSAAALAIRLIETLGDPTAIDVRAAVLLANLHLNEAALATDLAATLEPFLTWRAAAAAATSCDLAEGLAVDAAAACRLTLPESTTLVLNAGKSGSFDYLLINAADERVLAAGACGAGESCASAARLAADEEAIVYAETTSGPIVLTIEPLEPIRLERNAERPAYGAGGDISFGVDYEVIASLDGEVWLDLPGGLDAAIIIETVDLVDESLNGGFVDPVVGVFDIGVDTPAFYDDDGGEGYASQLGFRPEAGRPYQLYIGNIGGEGRFTLRLRSTIQGEALPALNSFSATNAARLDAQPLELGVVYTAEADVNGGAWYALPPLENRALRIETFELIGVDTIIDVYEADSATLILSDDDGGAGFGSSAVVYGEPGARYDIHVRNIGNGGQFALRVDPALSGAPGPRMTSPAILPPQTIEIGDALVIDVDGGAGAEAWLRYEASTNAPIVIETSSLLGVDTIVEIWTEDGESFLASDDDSGEGLGSRLEFTPEAGGVYWIKTRNFGETPGAFVLRLSAVGR